MRFKEFEGEWVKCKTGEIISVKSGKYDPTTDEQEFPCVELENLSQGSGQLLSTLNSKNQKSIKNIFHLGDVLFGKLRPYLRKYLLADFDGVCSSEIWVMKSNILDPLYLYAFVQSNAFLSLTEISSGSKMPRADWNLISASSIYYSNDFEERKKIGKIFDLINQRISTQSKIIEHLKTLRQNLSEVLFMRKLRFKFRNANDFPKWEEKKGDEVFDNISNKKHNSDLPILAITQEYGAIPRDLIEYQVSVTDKSVESYKVVELGDFIISLRSFQGGIEYSNYKGICSPAYIVLRNKIDIDNQFYKYYFKTDSYIKLLNRKLEGIRDGKMISYKYFSDISLPYPSKQEQTRIANFLLAIDGKIETERKLLHQYEEQKKHLLQSMFI